MLSKRNGEEKARTWKKNDAVTLKSKKLEEELATIK